MRVRDAEERDAAAIATIFDDAVAHSNAIWSERTVDAEDRARWMAARQDAGHPVLVAVDEAGEVLGYASFGPWRAADGYRLTVENSVHVRADHRRAGIGRVLMEALIGRALARGVHVMVAAVSADNEASLRFHEGFGFERCGVMRQVGAKFGSWLDLALLQLTLDDRAAPDSRDSGIRP